MRRGDRSIIFVYVFQLLLKSAHYFTVWTISPNSRQIYRKCYVLWNGIGKSYYATSKKNLIMILMNPITLNMRLIY